MRGGGEKETKKKKGTVGLFSNNSRGKTIILGKIDSDSSRRLTKETGRAKLRLSFNALDSSVPGFGVRNFRPLFKILFPSLLNVILDKLPTIFLPIF